MQYTDFLKGITQSKNIETGFDNISNADVHTSLGEMQLNFALTSDSTLPNEACVRAEAPNGDVYFFSTESGKVWKRTSAGSYSLVHTNANGAHLGARYFDGYIYFATSTKLGRFDLSSTWTDSFGTFVNGASYKPMAVKNLSLFIGDGNYVAAVDNVGAFSGNVLDLTSEYTITALVGSAYDLLCGTIIGGNVNKCGAFIWDTYSPSWTLDDEEIPENGVNYFIKGDGIIYAQIGTNGWIYYWNGNDMKRFFRLRETTSHGDQKTTVHNGRPMFAVGDKIYSLHRESESFPFAIVHEYTATQGTIKSIISSGSQLLVSNGENIDKIGNTYATAVIDTPEALGAFNKVIVKYYSIGDGAISIATNVDGEGYVAGEISHDSVRKTVSLEGGVGNCNFMQARVTLTPDTTNMIIKSITIE